MLRPLIGVAAFVVLFIAVGACAPEKKGEAPDDSYARQRRDMVEQQLAARGIKDKRVLQAMLDVPRHEFLPPDMRDRAYWDGAQPIGFDQTISQPYIVAFMTEQLKPQPTDVVLEVGTGSGYQAAVLAKLVKHVYTIEIIAGLAERAAKDLKRLGYTNVTVKAGDGYKGWKEHAPFDAIIVTCAPDHVPPPLVEQLREGGRMIIPVGERFSQELYLLEKKGGKVRQTAVLPVLFVPMTGEAENGDGN
jgi:protein-L-isoaspartate(D-aspartate) O-methyltransferase